MCATRLAQCTASSQPPPSAMPRIAATVGTAAGSAAGLRQAKKDLARIDGQLDRIAERVAAVHERMAGHASDHVALGRLSSDLDGLLAQQADLEHQWLEAADLLD